MNQVAERLEMVDVCALVLKLPTDQVRTLALGPLSESDCRICRVLGRPLPQPKEDTPAQRLADWHSLVGEVDDPEEWQDPLVQTVQATRCMVVYLAARLELQRRGLP